MEFSSILSVWNRWNIRGCVLLSLSLQVFLILFASLRKKTGNKPIVLLLWLAYLMADWVAAFTIGLITHNQSMPWARPAEIDEALQAFWASFLMLHLGGPDTITAFSLEDNSLWRRHLLSIVFQGGAAVYVFVQIFLNDKLLVIPTMLVFFAGVIKNMERLLALYLSSLPTLRESMLVQDNSSEFADDMLIQELNVFGNEYFDEEGAKLAESIVVKHAYYYHQLFKFFRGEIFTGDQELTLTCRYFKSICAMDALRVILVQLHFIYEVFHTKALAIHSMRSYIFRFIAFTNIVVALVLFNRVKKHRLPKLDVEITYTLLFGGIALDMVALIMLIFSDWTIGKIKWYKSESRKLYSFPDQLISTWADLRKPQFTTCEVQSNAKVTYAALNTPFRYRRWSESISACNLLSESLKECPRKLYKGGQCWGIIAFSYIYSFPFHVFEKIIYCFGQAGKTIAKGYGQRNKKVIIANTKYVSKNPFIKELWIFIFKEVRRKSNTVNNLTEMKNIFEARGDLFLRSRGDLFPPSSSGEIKGGNLLEYVIPATYGFSILTWHFATEIWYNREKQFMSSAPRNDEKEFSKMLSDYLLYLMLNRADLMSDVENNLQIIAAATLPELEMYIGDTTKDLEELCKTLYEDEVRLGTLVPPSPLRMGIKLAKEMEKIEAKKWTVMSGVWVEMLSYAANHTKMELHVQVPSKGGELLTFVRLLMVHFGVFNY